MCRALQVLKVFQEKRVHKVLQDPLASPNLAHQDPEAPQDPKVCHSVTHLSHFTVCLVIHVNIRPGVSAVSLCVGTGPSGGFGPPGEPGPHCKYPNPGTKGDPGSPGPDGDQGYTLMLINIRNQITLKDF